MNLDPTTIIMLLNLNLLVLQKLHIFKLSDPSLKGCLLAVVEDARNDRSQNTEKLPPRDSHNDKHDQVE